MLKVALTGNIASGKSQVEQYLNSFGIPTIDSDKIVLNLYTDIDFAQKLQNNFPNYDIISDKKIDKQKLAKFVFQDKKFKSNLENFVHPYVLKEIQNFCTKNSDKPLVIVAVPLLFECGWQKYFDKIILVTAEEKTRLQRLLTRNNLFLTDAQNRIDAQLKQETKIAFSDIIIENDGTLADLKIKTQQILGILNEQ